MSLRRAMVAFAASLTMLGGAANAAPAADLVRADVEPFMDGFFPYALQQADIAGAVVVVVKDGEVLFEKGYGYSDVARHVPMDPRTTLIRPGSISKLVTWSAVMQLVEAGKLDLDRDVNAYLDFRIPPGEGGPITLRRLMTHSAGFEESLKDMWSPASASLMTNEAYLKAWTPKRIFPAGRTAAYSNYGAALAGYIVQRVSGLEFDDYARARIFEPLGMSTASFEQPPVAHPGLQMSQGYRLASRPPGRFELLAPTPAGGLSVSGHDMGRFMIAHLADGEPILGSQAALRMHTEVSDLLPPVDGMVLGFYETSRNGRHVIGHGGDTQLFHSDLRLFLDDGVGLFVSLNSSGKPRSTGVIRTALFNAFADRYFPAAAPLNEPTVSTAKAHAALAAGLYESSRRSESGFPAIGRLLGQVAVRAHPDGTLSVDAFRGLNGEPKRWREVGPFVWREVGGQERMAARVENGRIVALGSDALAPIMHLQPVSWPISSAWLSPALAAAFLVLVVRVIGSIASMILRWRRRQPQRWSAPDMLARNLGAVASLVTIALVVTWAAVLDAGVSDLSRFASTLDPTIAFLQAGGHVAWAGLALACWGAALAWRRNASLAWRAWTTLCVLAWAPILWAGLHFNLIGGGLAY